MSMGPKIKPGAVLGRYRLGCLLGKGGQAEVYEAERVDVPGGARFALKVERVDTSEIRTDRWEHEGRLLRSIVHPAVVRVHDAGIQDDLYLYVVMDLLEGQTLFERVKRSGPLPLLDALLVAAEIACGLAALHAVGLVHRDVKPANVFLTSHGAKILDFGSGKVAGTERASQFGERPQTLAYAGPELQLEHAPLDPRSDVYSLGIVTWWALAGRSPWGEGLGTLALLRAVAEDMPAPLPDVPAEVNTLLGEMVVKALDQRPEMIVVAARLLGAARRIAGVAGLLGWLRRVLLRRPDPARLGAVDALYKRTQGEVRRVAAGRAILGPRSDLPAELPVLDRNGAVQRTVPTPPPSSPTAVGLNAEVTANDLDADMPTQHIATPGAPLVALAARTPVAGTVSAEPTPGPSVVDGAPASVPRSSTLTSASATVALRPEPSSRPPRSLTAAWIAVAVAAAIASLVVSVIVAVSVLSERRAQAPERVFVTSAAAGPRTIAASAPSPTAAAPAVPVASASAPAVPIASVPMPSTAAPAARAPSAPASGVVQRAAQLGRVVRTRAPELSGPAPSATATATMRAPFRMEGE
jgi:tRNA A-37 threonylcarbamoyl transferase component Bud32